MKPEKQIVELLPWMIKHRRELHKIPELLYKEVKTSAYLQKVLNKELGFKLTTVGTGIVVKIKGTCPSKTIGFRADMDALPINEEHESDYKSKHKGVMHACGHDGHMAMLLGFAKYLSMNPPVNNVVLVFQPAEEGGGLGAKTMIDSGLIDANVFYGLHIEPMIEVGKFASRKGVMMAGGEFFDVEFEGGSRHARERDGTQDAVFAAAKFIIDAEKLNKNEFIFQVGKNDGGFMAGNIADKAQIKGTMRFFETSDFEKAKETLSFIAKDIEKQNIAKVKIAYTGKVYPPLINTPSEVEKIENLDGFQIKNKIFCIEDMSLYIKKYSGMFIELGAKTDGKNPIHTSKFTFNEKALAVGLQLFKTLLI